MGTVRHERLAVHEVTVSLPGALDCFVYGPPLRSYSCGLYVGDREEPADRAFNDASAELRQCLGRSWKARERADGLGAETRLSGGRGAPLARVVLHEHEAAGYAVDVFVEAPRSVRARAARPTRHVGRAR